jgi:hypothetical protein
MVLSSLSLVVHCFLLVTPFGAKRLNKERETNIVPPSTFLVTRGTRVRERNTSFHGKEETRKEETLLSSLRPKAKRRDGGKKRRRRFALRGKGSKIGHIISFFAGKKRRCRS